MEYLVTVFILVSEYYTFTYGAALLIKQKNRLGGVAVIVLALVSAILAITLLFMKQR